MAELADARDSKSRILWMCRFDPDYRYFNNYNKFSSNYSFKRILRAFLILIPEFLDIYDACVTVQIQGNSRKELVATDANIKKVAATRVVLIDCSLFLCLFIKEKTATNFYSQRSF